MKYAICIKTNRKHGHKRVRTCMCMRIRMFFSCGGVCVKMQIQKACFWFTKAKGRVGSRGMVEKPVRIRMWNKEEISLLMRTSKLFYTIFAFVLCDGAYRGLSFGHRAFCGLLSSMQIYMYISYTNIVVSVGSHAKQSNEQASKQTNKQTNKNINKNCFSP